MFFSNGTKRPLLNAVRHFWSRGREGCNGIVCKHFDENNNNSLDTLDPREGVVKMNCFVQNQKKIKGEEEEAKQADSEDDHI